MSNAQPVDNSVDDGVDERADKLDTLPTVPHTDLSMLSDRELLESLYRTHQEILTLIRELKEMTQPMMDKVANSPVLRTIFGG